MKMTTIDYLEYVENAYKKINNSKEYVTNLDSELGDGDHWININMGLEAVVEKKENLKNLTIKDLLKNIGMILMTKIGGSSGVLYGSSYINAAKNLEEIEVIDIEALYSIMNYQLLGMMERGNTEYGDKTMVDPLYLAVEEFKREKENIKSDIKNLIKVKEAAYKGMLATKDMAAKKGRGRYREDKGVGHIDAGAVTMFYQIEELVNYIINKENILIEEENVMSKIVNEPKKEVSEKIKDLRGAIEHRATWFYCMINEARKAGIPEEKVEEFARKAIFNCGCFHGKTVQAQTDDLKVFGEAFANPNVVDIFEMDVKNDGKELAIDFGYCPLVSAWKKLTNDEKDIALLCDIAMDGDRGIISQYENFEFELGKTIAKGDAICEVRIRDKRK
jgi:dihydroxyacetone kinase-like protein